MTEYALEGECGYRGGGPGNADFALRLTNAAPNASADVLIPAMADAASNASLSLPIALAWLREPIRYSSRVKKWSG